MGIVEWTFALLQFREVERGHLKDLSGSFAVAGRNDWGLNVEEIAGLKADIQMLRNQLLGLRQTVDALPPAASIARLDEDVNVLWEPQDGCLAWTGPKPYMPAPPGGGAMQVFAPCTKAPSPDSVMWRLRRVPLPR